MKGNRPCKLERVNGNEGNRLKYVKPKALCTGDTIGIIAPASPLDREYVDQAVALFQGFGYQIKLGESVYQSYGYLSGSDACRATDVEQMFADSTVKAIICMRGGYGTTRILDLLDYDMIQKKPKIFVGYSDITALHLALQKRAGLVTFQGPVLSELATSYDPLSWYTLFQHITESKAFGVYREPADMFQFTITDGMAEGVLVGGNLSLLTSTMGTPYEIDTKGKIWLIEDVDEQPYRIDRMLTQFRSAGKLQEANGIIFTDFANCEPVRPDKSLTIQQILHDIVKPLGIPAYFGLKAGHCSPNLTIPLGVKARMDATAGSLEILEPSVV
jgi:muramoyltetrapeptide carboxypeptidase